MDDLLIRFDGGMVELTIKCTGFADDYAGISKNKNKHKARKDAQAALDEAVRWAVALREHNHLGFEPVIYDGYAAPFSAQSHA